MKTDPRKTLMYDTLNYHYVVVEQTSITYVSLSCLLRPFTKVSGLAISLLAQKRGVIQWRLALALPNKRTVIFLICVALIVRRNERLSNCNIASNVLS